MKRFELVQAKSVEEAVKSLPDKGQDTKIKGGGIDLISLIKDRVLAPNKLVNILRIDGLGKIEASDKGAKVGALVTLTEAAKHDKLRKEYTAFAVAADEAATPQVRNVATVGGNLCQRPRCWYFRSPDFNCLKKGGSTCYAIEGENQYHAIIGYNKCAIVHPSNLAPALIALDGKINIHGPQGQKTVSAEDFFKVSDDDLSKENILAPNEVITSVELSSGWKSAYLEVREKQSFDWPLVAVAVALKIDGGKCTAARIVLGAVAPKPWRVQAAEDALKGQNPKDNGLLGKISSDAASQAKPLRNNGYKVTLLKTLIQRAILAAAQ